MARNRRGPSRLCAELRRGRPSQTGRNAAVRTLNADMHSAKAFAHVAARASCDWEWRTDGGKTWTRLPSTLQVKTTLAGVVPGTTAQCRFRSVTNTGASSSRQPATLLVQ